MSGSAQRDDIDGTEAGLNQPLNVIKADLFKALAHPARLKLVDVLADQAEARGWSKLVMNAPRQPDTGRKVFEKVAAPADWHSYILRFDD